MTNDDDQCASCRRPIYRRRISEHSNSKKVWRPGQLILFSTTVQSFQVSYLTHIVNNFTRARLTYSYGYIVHPAEHRLEVPLITQK